MFKEPESALANGAMDDEKGKVIVQVRALSSKECLAPPRTPRHLQPSPPAHRPTDARAPTLFLRAARVLPARLLVGGGTPFTCLTREFGAIDTQQQTRIGEGDQTRLSPAEHCER